MVIMKWWEGEESDAELNETVQGDEQGSLRGVSPEGYPDKVRIHQCPIE
jgi:hypothetical protein